MNRLASFLRTLADRIDYEGAPKATHWTFTFEKYKGIRFREDGRGWRLWYLRDADYEKAHDESDDPPVRIDWKALCDNDGTEHGIRLPDGSTLYHRPWQGWEHEPFSSPFLKRDTP